MSFSSDVKTELSAVNMKAEHCRRAELAGIVFMSASLSINKRGVSLVLSTEHMPLVKRVISLIEKLYDVKTELSTRTQAPKKTLTYIIEVYGYDEVMRIIGDLGLKIDVGILPDPLRMDEILKEECCRACFVRGAFLGAGSISDPNKDYHLEFVANLQEFAAGLLNTINGWDMNAKLAKRKQNHIVYMKEIEHIIRLLTVMGAYSSVLELENIRIVKDIRNNVNRQINCDNANMDKTINSAQKQIADIRLIEDMIGVHKLPHTLKVTAELRLKYPEASLQELANILGSTTRSGINHRLRKISSIAENIANKKEK
jgi:DNA-binding protein WhiA